MTLRDLLETHRARLIIEVYRTDELLAALETADQTVVPELISEKIWWLLEALYRKDLMTTRELAKRSGVSRSTVPWHADRHPELFSNVGERRLAEWTLTDRGRALVRRRLNTKAILRNGKP